MGDLRWILERTFRLGSGLSAGTDYLETEVEQGSPIPRAEVTFSHFCAAGVTMWL